MDVDLRACIDGDRNAWTLFVDRFSGVIFAAVLRTLRSSGRTDRNEVADPVQEVFVRLVRDDFRLLRTYDRERASLSTWLTLIARSVAIDHLRKRRLDTVPMGPSDCAAPEPAAAVTDGPPPPLHLLTARQRLVLRMLFDEDMSVPEAAAMLGVDDQTIRSTKHKALIRLREAMAVPEN